MTDLLDDRFFANPHAYYRHWREEGPVRRVHFGDGVDRWLILGYEEARAALADPRLCKDIDGLEAAIERKYDGKWERPRTHDGLRHMLNADPPTHTRLRKAVSQAFTARRVAALRPVIESTAHELLDAMAEHDEVDLLQAFAVPLPVTVICHLLDVDIEDRSRFREWTKALVGTLDPDIDRARAHDEMVSFLRNMLQRKRIEPGEDMLSALVTDEDARLNEGELIGTALLLLVAGHETTVNLIGNGTLALLRDRPWLDRLCADPTLIPAAVEEFLRYDGPVNTATLRFTTEPITIGDTVIPAGEMVLIALAAANRDPHQFTDPHNLNPSADRPAHLAFGHGIHYCVGAPLARLEGQIAFATLLQRFPNLELAVDDSHLHWYPNAVIHGLKTLPVRLQK
ncbi:cytochrome P450 [Nocardia sp. CDC153]|uniref:cytochrome P450 family protein n=1 Tax=Nocardia sp. CDC153 TaxID=3112167 RepID=UPI002DBF3DF9|nr:cytochrome P450 [Nocardia sp. CDC153]MEC3956888.1 cytochrome P450 [Nocardia sp. CDC153]